MRRIHKNISASSSAKGLTLLFLVHPKLLLSCLRTLLHLWQKPWVSQKMTKGLSTYTCDKLNRGDNVDSLIYSILKYRHYHWRHCLIFYYKPDIDLLNKVCSYDVDIVMLGANKDNNKITRLYPTFMYFKHKNLSSINIQMYKETNHSNRSNILLGKY